LRGSHDLVVTDSTTEPPMDWNVIAKTAFTQHHDFEKILDKKAQIEKG